MLRHKNNWGRLRIFAVIFWGILLGLTSVQAQQVYVLNGHALYEEPFFDSAFIAENHIKQVTARVSYKDDNRPVKRLRTFWQFEYDQQGTFVRENKILDRGSWLDSLNVALKFNKVNQIVHRRERNSFGIHYYAFEYNAEGLPFREVYSRPAVMELDSRSVFFNYQQFGDTILKKIHVNKLELPFKEELFKYNDLGNPVEYTEKRHITGLTEHRFWKYNERDQLVELTIEKYKPTSKTTVYRYIYNDSGRLEVENVFENEEQTEHNEFVYKNGKLDAFLSRDEITHRITIIEFAYEYY